MTIYILAAVISIVSGLYQATIGYSYIIIGLPVMECSSIRPFHVWLLQAYSMAILGFGGVVAKKNNNNNNNKKGLVIMAHRNNLLVTSDDAKAGIVRKPKKRTFFKQLFGCGYQDEGRIVSNRKTNDKRKDCIVR